MSNFLSDNQTVGTILKQEREKQNKTIQEVSEITHIRAIFLSNIEDDNFESLPSKLHITGFLKVYSQCLELNEHEVLNIYKRQMLLLQDIPSEEIFAITKKKTKTKKQKFYILVFLTVILLSMLLFFSLNKKNKQAIVPDIVLTENRPKAVVSALKGEEFSFIVKGYKHTYRLLDITNSSVTLSNITTQTTIPPFLYTESLEHDVDNNSDYDYIIHILERQGNKILFEISLINVQKNPGQLDYAIIQNNTDLKIPDSGVLSVQNISTNKLLLITTDIQNQNNKIELNPMQTQTILYFDKQKKPKYSSIYVQDINSVTLQIDKEDIIWKPRRNTRGEIGIVSCITLKKNQEKITCKVEIGTI